jgi:uncharacterized membrane protein YuzA (DUF378 family)
MISLIKNFRKMIPKQFQVIILSFISVFALILRLEGETDVLDFFKALLPIALVLFAVYVLESREKTVVSHLVLFLFVFADYLGTFIRTIFSYNLNTNTFVLSITWQLILGLVVCVYLILIILSYLLTEGAQLKYTKSHLLFPMILVFIYLYIRFGISTAMITLIPIVIVYFVKVPLAVVSLLLSVVIVTPLDMLDVLLSGVAGFTTIFYWLVSLFAFYLIYLLVKELLSSVHEKHIEENKNE